MRHLLLFHGPENIENSISSIGHMFLLKYKFLILCSVEYSYITGLSLICPLKVSRALVSVCFLGQCSYVSQGGWCVPCPVYLTLVLLKLEWKWLYQPARQSRTFPDHYSVHCNFYTHHSLNSNHPGVEQIYSNDSLQGAESQKPDDY